MGRVIQMVKISDDKSIFLTDFDDKTNELSFRSSLEPKQLQKETIAIVGPNVKTNLYFFNKAYLTKFIQENQS